MHLSRIVRLILAGSAAVAGCQIERNPPVEAASGLAADASSPQSIGTVIYHVADLAAAREFYTRLLGRQPYFDEPFYVGYQVAGNELGLDPDTAGASPGGGGVVAYWTVDDVDAALVRARALGATEHGAVQEVGGGVRTATVLDPFGNVIGFIDNPAFAQPPR
jgi:predicted enzyme related to lactoylglutathione lyase